MLHTTGCIFAGKIRYSLVIFASTEGEITVRWGKNKMPRCARGADNGENFTGTKEKEAFKKTFSMSQGNERGRFFDAKGGKRGLSLYTGREGEPGGVETQRATTPVKPR